MVEYRIVADFEVIADDDRAAKILINSQIMRFLQSNCDAPAKIGKYGFIHLFKKEVKNV